jgi:ABC-type xylose transport system permease subunit
MANGQHAAEQWTESVVVSGLVKAYTHVIVGCVVVMVTASVLHQYRDVLPWVVAIVVLAIVGRVVWARTNY